jgi:hypothetical protein
MHAMSAEDYREGAANGKNLKRRYWTVFEPDAFRLRKTPSRSISEVRRHFRVLQARNN